MNYKKEYERSQRENKQLKAIIEDNARKSQRIANRRNLFLKTFGSFFVGRGLKNSIRSFIAELRNDKALSEETIADLGANIIWRFTRIGLFALAISAIPIALLFYQNQLFSNQNAMLGEQTVLIENQKDLIINQNELIRQQTLLSEASRRSGQTFILGEVLSDMNQELELKSNRLKYLSDMLTGRIIGLSQVLKPYRYLVNDTLISLPLSPERAQLLISLVESNIDTTFLRTKIFANANFDYADFEGVTFDNKHLSGVSSRYSNFKNTRFYDCNLSGASFAGSNFDNSHFEYCSSKMTNYYNIKSNKLSFQSTTLNKADFKDAKITNGAFFNNDLSKIRLDGSILNNVVFDGIRLPKLSGASVGRGDWLEYIQDSLIVGNVERIVSSYNVDSVKRKQKSGYFYILKPKAEVNFDTILSWSKHLRRVHSEKHYSQ